MCEQIAPRFVNALLSPRFRQRVGTLVLRGKGGILSLDQDSKLVIVAVLVLTGVVAAGTALGGAGEEDIDGSGSENAFDDDSTVGFQ